MELTSAIAKGEVARWGDGTLKGELLDLFLAAYPGAVLVRYSGPNGQESEVYEVWIEQPKPKPKAAEKVLRCPWAGDHKGVAA